MIKSIYKLNMVGEDENQDKTCFANKLHYFILFEMFVTL